MQSRNPVPAILGIVFSFLFLASLGARFWANDAAYEVTGPSHIASDDEHVYVNVGREIVQLSTDGKLLARQVLGTGGLPGDPIDLRVLADGRLLIVGQRPGRIYGCRTSTWQCDELAPGMLVEVERQLKVLPDDARSRLLISDARGDKLWGVSLEGGGSEQLLPDATLAGPNDLAFDDYGALWMADTDHRRIVEFKPAADGVLAEAREHSTSNELTVGERFYPIMLARDEAENWWVTQATEFSSRYADLVIYHPDNGVQKRVTLPGGVFAADISRSGQNMLVTDLETFTIFAVDQATHEVSAFGDARFKSLLSGLRAQRHRYQQLSHLALAGVIVFAILAIGAALKATPPGKRWTPPPRGIDLEPGQNTMPRIRGVYWLERDPRMERTIRMLEPLVYGLIALAVVGAFVLYAWLSMQAAGVDDSEIQSKANQAGLIILVASLLLGSTVFIVRLSMKAMKRRLGTDGHNVHIMLTDSRELTVAPENLAYNERAIFYRQYSLPLQSGKRQNIYRQGEVETYLAPLLHRARKLTGMQSLRHQWKHRDHLLIWSLVYIGAIILLAGLLALWTGGIPGA